MHSFAVSGRSVTWLVWGHRCTCRPGRVRQEPTELLTVCRYYPLNMTYFKSGLDSHMLDLLWNKYWVNTLSSSPLLGTRDLTAGQIADIGEPCAEAAVCMRDCELV